MNKGAAPIVQRVQQSTIDALWRWAAWRQDGEKTVLGSGGSLLGRLIGGRRLKRCERCKGTKRVQFPPHGIKAICPTCGGAGHVPENLDEHTSATRVECDYCEIDSAGRPTGEIRGRTCFRCRGSGSRLIEHRTVHPALIPGTRIFGKDPDRRSPIIHSLVFSWAAEESTFWMHHITIAWYDIERGQSTQELVALQMGVSRQFFEKILRSAHLAVQERLTCRY